ncbi:MAG TPA: hypothetical protein VJV77_09260 [Casimicrobiaceae bacterium]|nr:hypothetical protein [Casimicrobiaceae bacterium]
MRCASCAAENPAGARFCIQCGAEHALPTPIAAVAAAVSGQRGHATVARAANAAQADLPHEYEGNAERRSRASVIVAASTRGPRSTPEHHGGTPDHYGRTSEPDGSMPDRHRGTREYPVGAQPASARTQPAPAGAQPAYAQGPANGHLAAFLIALAFAIAAVAFGAWKMLGGQLPSDGRVPRPNQSVMSSFPPEETPSPRRPIGSPTPALPSGASSPDASPPRPPADATSQAPRASEDKAGEAGTATSASATQPIEIRSLPAKPAPRPPHRRPTPEKAQPAAQAPAVQAPEPSPARAPEVAAAPAAQPSTVDRWTRMADELSRCTREDFITRVICDQRVRFRYCGNYWGKVPQCPGSPAPERGQ